MSCRSSLQAIAHAGTIELQRLGLVMRSNAVSFSRSGYAARP
ncbi:hypothetical protein [Pectobacterium actinidiae]